jgi:hypothetical protein
MAFLVPSSAQKTVRSVLMAQIEHLGGQTASPGEEVMRSLALEVLSFECTSFATFFGGTERTVTILLNDDIFSLILLASYLLDDTLEEGEIPHRSLNLQL